MTQARRFRCKYGKHTVWTPLTEYDVLEAVKHPDYEEIDSEGNVIVHLEQSLQRIPITTAQAPTEQRKTLKLKKRR